MSRSLMWLSGLLVSVTLVGCTGEPPTPKPQNESTQGSDTTSQGSDTTSESKSSSGSDSR